jgi:glutaminyl-tRNA synthetase
MNFIEEKIIERGEFDRLKLRFPPEPNGTKTISIVDGEEVIKYNSGLHLGHAKSMCLNFGIAEKYGAPCILRFDDTNPITEEFEYVASMLKDISWLGFKPSKVTYTSDYFSEIYDKEVLQTIFQKMLKM